MKCKILMPHRNDITPETIKSLSEFPTEWNGIKFEGVQLPNSSIIQARNDLLWGGEGTDSFDDSVDLYLFWDSDNTGTIDDFKLMLELEKPIVLGLYPFNKKPELEPYFVGGCFIEGYPGCIGDNDYIPITEKRIFEGSNLWGGLGFGLIRKPALKKMGYPWVDSITVKTPDYYPRPCEIVTDDIGFCLKAHQSRVPIVLDGRLNLGHVSRETSGIAPASAIPAGLYEFKDNMDAEAMAATGILCQMADKIKYLSEQCVKLLREKEKRSSPTPKI